MPWGFYLIRDLAIGVVWIAALNALFLLPRALGEEAVLTALANDPASAALVSVGNLVLLGAFLRIHLATPRQAASLRLRPLWQVAQWLTGAVLVLFVLDALGVMLYQQIVPVPPESYEWLYVFTDGPYGWLPLILTVVVVGPLIEEVVFRGWIQRRLERHFKAFAAILVTAVLFAAAHMIPLLVPYYFLMGIVFGYAVYWSRSLWTGVILHMAMNGYTVAFVFLGPPPERVEAWAPDLPVLAGMLAAFVVFAVALVIVLRQLRPLRGDVIPGSGNG